MTDKITIDRAVVERALKALERADRIAGHKNNWSETVALRAALEQPQVEQEPVAVIGDVWTLNWVGSDPIATIVKKHGLKIGDKLYTHPQNLRCKSTQARLATFWGYEKPQSPRQPLTDQVHDLIASMVAELRAHRYCGDCYPENGWPDVNKVLAEYTAFKRAHGIGGEA